MSLCRLTRAVFACGRTGGVGGRGREEAGDESTIMGSALEFPVFSECMRMLDGRLKGESAVVRRRFRSELREDDESARGEGRFGSVYREDEGFARASGAVAGFKSLECECWLTLASLPSLKKSIHVSPSWARKCDATTPCEWCLELLPITASRAPSIMRLLALPL